METASRGSLRQWKMVATQVNSALIKTNIARTSQHDHDAVDIIVTIMKLTLAVIARIGTVAT